MIGFSKRRVSGFKLQHHLSDWFCTVTLMCAKFLVSAQSSYSYQQLVDNNVMLY